MKLSDHRLQGVVTVNSPDYLHQMFSNLAAGTVSVPLRHADDSERLTRTGLTDVTTPAAGGGWVSGPYVSRPGDELAQISFTSGTEGAPKAVYLSRTNLHIVTQRLVSEMQLTDAVREYIGVPVYHSFGYGRARAVLHAGGQCFIPAGGFDLIEIRDMLRRDEINAISAVPSLWRIFLQGIDLFDAESLAKVKWVEIGSQHMAASEKRALKAALPNACILQHYGLTEASRTTFLRIDTAPESLLGSVGQVTPPAQMKITDAGQVAIRGPHVALGVDTVDGFEPLGSDRWFETQDCGHITDGYLFFDGRADDLINLSGVKVSPDLIEAHIRQTLPQAGDFGILRRADPLRGEGLLLLLTPDSAAQEPAIKSALETYLRDNGISGAGATQTRQIETLPRTDTGKLQRKQLAAQLSETQAPERAADDSDFARQLGEILGLSSARTCPQNFHDLGGDSLIHLQLTLVLERHFGAAPAQWEQIAIGDLIRRADTVTDAPEPQGTPPLPLGDRNMNPAGISFWDLIREDYRTNDSSLTHQGFWMLFIHRFGNWRMDVRPRLLRAPLTILYRVLNKLTQPLFGMKLDYTVQVGRRVKLEHFGGMILGARQIGDDVVLRQNTTMGIRTTQDLRAKPTLGNGVDVGAGAVIAGNIHIGENSIIGANTVVFTNIPPNSVVMGVPGKIIGKTPPREQS